MTRSSFPPIAQRWCRLLACGLFVVVTISLAGAENGHAATLTQGVVIPGAPVSVTTTSPLALSVDFGTAFASIDRIVITSTFDVSDLLQIGDNYVLADADGVGVQKTQVDATPVVTSDILIQGGAMFDVLLDGQWDFEYRMYQGSVSLSSLEFAITGTPVPEPSTALLLAPGLLGLTLAGRRRRQPPAIPPEHP